MMAPAPPFPVLVIGSALQVRNPASSVAHSVFFKGYFEKDAQANGFVAALKDDSAVKINFLHAAYSIFCFV